MTRGLKAEAVDVRRQIQIVVDRLRHVDDPDPARGALFELHRRVRRVVAADRDELSHVEPQQREHGIVQVRGVRRRVGARDAEVRAAAEMDPADRLDGERHHVIDVAAHDPFEPVAQADHLDALETRANRRGADDAVDPWGGAAADENCEVVVMLHPLILADRRGPTPWGLAVRPRFSTRSQYFVKTKLSEACIVSRPRTTAAIRGRHAVDQGHRAARQGRRCEGRADGTPCLWHDRVGSARPGKQKGTPRFTAGRSGHLAAQDAGRDRGPPMDRRRLSAIISATRTARSATAGSSSRRSRGVTRSHRQKRSKGAQMDELIPRMLV